MSFTQKEVEKVISKITNLEDKVLFLLGINTGIRREDIVNIELQNINLNNNTLTFTEKKKGSRIRTLHLSPEMAQELQIYINTMPKNQKYLFDFTGKTAYNKIQALCDRAEIKRRPFHALRSTCIKLAQSRGWSPEQVAELTGDTIRVIQEHYSVPSDSEMKEVAQDKPIW